MLFNQITKKFSNKKKDLEKQILVFNCLYDCTFTILLYNMQLAPKQNMIQDFDPFSLQDEIFTDTSNMNPGGVGLTSTMTDSKKLTNKLALIRVAPSVANGK